MSKFRYFSRFEKLEREERESILPNSAPRRQPTSESETELSPAQPYNGLQREATRVKGRQSGGPKAATRAAALDDIEKKLSRFVETDFADPSLREKYKSLRRAQLALEASPRNVPARPGGKAKVFTGPIGSEWPLTASGTAARYTGQTSAAGKPQLHRKSRLLPCIERYTRRAALFAIGKAGKGWRTPHRKRKHSWIDC